jgi:glucose-1-phosphate adenylyltransferase
MRQTIVFLLAGGEGTRLYPLTRRRAKPAVPFGGMWRLIDFTLSNCLHSGLTRIGILAQYESESLTRHVVRVWRSFGAPLGESIDVLVPVRKGAGERAHGQLDASQDGCAPAREHARTRRAYRGTADAVFQNMDVALREGARDIVVLCGDHVYAMDYRPFLAFHRERDAELTIAAFPVPAGEASRFGILEAREDGRIVKFVEKPRDPAVLAPAAGGTVMASMGVYIFKTRTLLKEEQERGLDAPAVDFGSDVIPRLIDRARVYCFPFACGPQGHTSYWRDVGTLDSYFRSHMELLGPAPAFDLHNRAWPILHASTQTGPSVFGEALAGGARNSIVGGGCRIDGVVADSVVAPQVRVEAGARVSRSILFSGVHVEAGARVCNAILDKNVRVARGALLGGDGVRRPYTCDGNEVTYTPGGIVVVAAGAFVGGGSSVAAADAAEAPRESYAPVFAAVR